MCVSKRICIFFGYDVNIYFDLIYLYVATNCEVKWNTHVGQVILLTWIFHELLDILIEIYYAECIYYMMCNMKKNVYADVSEFEH